MDSEKYTIHCHLKSARKKKKLSQVELAERVGVKRQAIYDMECGKYMPNTAVALRLARELDCTVEDLFALESPADNVPVVMGEKAEPESRVSVIGIRDRLVAYPVDDKWMFGDGFQAADGMVDREGRSVRLLDLQESVERNILVMGCDPALALLNSYISRRYRDIRASCRFASSLKALECLAAGCTHVAGTHLHNSGEMESNLAFAQQILAGTKVTVFAFSMFEEGLMVAPGNPLGIRSVSDLAENGIRLVNRENGAALRALLDDCLADAGIAAESVNGYTHLVFSHAQGAQMVAYGLADAALGLRAVALNHGLEFVPIQAVRFDLVIPHDLLDLPAVQILLNILQSHAMRKELATLPGYESSCTGKRIGEVGDR